VVSVRFESSGKDHHIEDVLIFLQVSHEVFPVITHVHQNRLLNFFKEEFMLMLFNCRVCEVAEVLITDVGVEQYII
jgi:hypothetical protein